MHSTAVKRVFGFMFINIYLNSFKSSGRKKRNLNQPQEWLLIHLYGAQSACLSRNPVFEQLFNNMSL